MAAAFADWEEAPRRGLLNREGCSRLSVYSVTKRLRRWKAATGDVCYSAVKEVYFWERVHTSSIPSA